MAELHKQGFSYAKIGKMFGVKRQRVHQIVTGYKSPKKINPPKERPDWIIDRHIFSHIKEIQDFLFNRASNNQNGFTIPKIGEITKTTKMRSGSRERIREIIRIRDGHICQWCGREWKKGERRLDIHHINGTPSHTKMCDRDFFNQITLCHLCHKKIDGYKQNKLLTSY